MRFVHALAVLSMVAPLGVQAATPASGTLTDTSGQITFTSVRFVQSNPTPTPEVDDGPRCNANTNFCDSFQLTVALPDDYATKNPNDAIRITTTWDVPGSDIDVWVYRGTVGDLTGNNAGYRQAASASMPEVAILPIENGTNVFTIKIVPFAASGAQATTIIELVPGLIQEPPPPLEKAPRHVVLMSPSGVATNAGEPSIGFNLQSKQMMFVALATTYRVTAAELSGQKDAADNTLPMSCPATWTDVTPPFGPPTTLDPILVTDQTLGEDESGRTFVSQLTGNNSAFAYTDDDGENWLPGQVGVSNGGVDHQTVGSGPYPAPSLTFPAPPPQNPGYAVYYCSQSIGDAFCARSDDGGATFGPGRNIGKATDLGCATGDIGALHGHVRIAPDGTLALPMKSCAGQQGVIISTDAGTTFTASKVPGSTSGNTDPQLAWSKPGPDGKINGYFCYVDGDGRVKVSKTSNKGQTWSPSYDIGAEHGIRNAVFAQAIAGDHDRAACAFIGTTTIGNSGATDFPGVWHGYIAYTFDGGTNWHTFNVTPNDPVQGRGGICTGGISCGSNRNLLDFNEITIDDRARVLFGYADGCITPGCIGSGGANNDFTDKGAIVRQIGGRSLYAAYDAQVPVVPQAPCLFDKELGHAGESKRDETGAHLAWNTPDDGGKPITGYRVYRATAVTGPYELVGTVALKNAYHDATADPEVAEYFYKVVPLYDVGGTATEGVASNIIRLPVTLTPPPGSQFTLHFHGNPTHDDGHADEGDCTGTGASDILACNGPFLSRSAVLADGPAAHWEPVPGANGVSNRTIYDATWVWTPDAPTLLESPMKVQFWASGAGVARGVSDADWFIRLYVDGALAVDQRVTATPAAANVADLLTATLPLPPGLVATSEVILYIDPVYTASQQDTHIYYDSTAPCPTATDPEVPCNSRVTFGPDPIVDPGNLCELPGIGLMADPEGDATGGIPEHDLLEGHIAQPYAADGVPLLIFTLQVGRGAALPPSSTWFISFRSPDNELRGLRMVTDSAGTPAFQRYIVGTTSPTGGTPVRDGRVAQAGSIQPLEPGSSFDAATRQIRLVVKATDLALNAPGDTLSGFNSGVMQVTPTGGALLVEQMPDGSVLTARSALTFALGDNADCAPNAAPLASLGADVQEGEPPLEVTFTVSGTDIDNDELVTWSLDFGDGEELVDQPFDGATSVNVAHTYNEAGNYPARLTVTDANGNVSSNTAERVIVVLLPAAPPIADAGDDLDVVELAGAGLDGSASSDPNGDALTFAWAQVTRPDVPVTLATPGAASTAFTAPAVCTDTPIQFRLTVTEQTPAALADTADVVVTVLNQNTAPDADAGADFAVREGAGALLSVSVDDPDCDSWTYEWQQIDGPSVALSSYTAASPTFTAPEVTGPTQLLFLVTVTDSAGASSVDSIVVTVEEDPTIGNNAVGALPSVTLLMLGLLGALRTRRRR